MKKWVCGLVFLTVVIVGLLILRERLDQAFSAATRAGGG